MIFNTTIQFAQQQDKEDPLQSFRDRFHIPCINGKETIYLCGNSLGLQPKSVPNYLDNELRDWAELAVEGHSKANNPWLEYHKLLKPGLARLVGAGEHEVIAMNSLTTNLHLMLVSFYRPTSQRFKILIERGAFSSDQYAIESQVRFHGYDPNEAIIELAPTKGTHTLKNGEILKCIADLGDETALVLLGGVNYYTGQTLDMYSITQEAHKYGAFVGFDLAHAIGNIELHLNQWEVDFAVWCSYKYLNSGPGGVGGAFIHEKYKNANIPRFAGWWGHNEEERFNMEKGFKPMIGADGWQLSNAPVLSMAVQKASLDIFEEAGMDRLITKSQSLTGYLEYLLKEIQKQYPSFEIITPPNKGERGCQLSLLFKENMELIYNSLNEAGVIVDKRKPDVIRVAPVPLYNSYLDVYKFHNILKRILDH